MALEDRPQYQHGTGTIGGLQFHWGSGTPGQYWSVPYGDYPVTPNAPTGAWAHKAGAIPIANNVIPDAQLGRNRIGIMIHSGSAASLDQLYTEGCFKVAPSEWPGVRQEILAEAQKGPLYLHVQPGGVASFTSASTLQPAGNIPTATSSAPPVSASPVSHQTSGNSFVGALGQIESNNQNIFSGVDKDYAGQPGSRSQGYYQIDTPTWQTFAAKAGIDTTKYPNAMSAPQETQAQVASLIPLSRFGARTQRMLGQQFGQLDASKTIGELAQGTTLTSVPTPPHTLTPSTAGAPYTPTAVATANAPPAAPAAPSFGEAIRSGDVGGALKAAITKPTTKDAQGNTVEGKSLADKVASVFGGDKPPPEIPAMQSAMPAQDPDPGLAPAASQLFSTVQQSAARPLSWTSAPYGANAGLIRPGGTTLNATDYGYG